MPIQLHQNINLATFLILGSFVAHIYLGWVDIATIIIFTIIIEHLFLYFNPKREFYFSYSAISTAIGLIVLMYSANLWLYFFVITLALFQKHFITIHNRHFFNPSNFAIIIALFLFYKDAHIISGQFGDELWLSMVVCIVALIMLIRVNRWIISLSFIISYFLLQYLLIIHYDPVLSFEMIYRRFYSISFMLFIYFMLTDPVVTPHKSIYQTIFGFLIALVAVLFDRFYGFRVQHLFMSVFILSPFVTIFSLCKSKRDKIISTIIIIFVLITVIVIEQQPPFYFEMEG